MKKETNPNDAALPIHDGIWDKEQRGFFNNVGDRSPLGLTKREHFAALAMQGLCVGKKTNDIMTGQCVDIANEAVEIADALIAALNEEVSNG
jgi:hypothetical protein